jgi:flagellar operon protein
MSSSPFLYPNVSRVPGSGQVGGSERAEPNRKPGEASEFDSALGQALKSPATESKPVGPDLSRIDGRLGNHLGSNGDQLSQIREPLKFSQHAQQRLSERKIQLNPEMMARLSDAVDKAQAKGVEDTLVLTPDAALIVNTKNRTVITAMDRGSLNGNVFTQIDGAVIL